MTRSAGPGDNRAAMTESAVELEERRWLVEGLPILDEVAARLAVQLGLPADDLRSIGHEALTGLLRRYQPSRSPLAAYLRVRLRWAILDGIRRESHGRTAAARARALEASMAVTEAASPPDEAALRGIEEHQAELRAILGTHAVALAAAFLAPDAHDSSRDPERVASRRQMAGALGRALGDLGDPRQRAIVERHYFAGESIAAIARDLGLSKPYVSRLHADAIATLHRRLRGTAADPNT
jgi:RNA polymerase sigma factor FliA